MKVKERYSTFSEPLMFEWTLETPTPFNRQKRQHYAYWLSVKELDVKELTFDDALRMDKIQTQHNKDLKRPTYRRR